MNYRIETLTGTEIDTFEDRDEAQMILDLMIEDGEKDLRIVPTTPTLGLVRAADRIRKDKSLTPIQKQLKLNDLSRPYRIRQNNKRNRMNGYF